MFPRRETGRQLGGCPSTDTLCRDADAMQDPKGKNVRPVSRQVSNVPAPVRHWHVGLGKPKTERTIMTVFSNKNRAAANGLPVTRRRALAGLAGLAAGSAVASPALAETPLDRLERLTAEMAEALVEWTEGQFMAVVYPANHSEFPSRVEFRNCRLPARQRRDYHLAQFKRAAEEVDPAIADWQVTLDESGRNDCPILISAYRFTGSYDGDGTYEKVGS